MINSYPFSFCTHCQLTNAHHRHTNSYFHAVSESVTRHTQRHVAEKLACTIGELCGHWDRVMYALVPLTCMHGGNGGVVTMTTTFLW